MHQYTTAPPADPLKQAKSDLDNVYVLLSLSPRLFQCHLTRQQRYHGTEHRLDLATRRASRPPRGQDRHSCWPGLRVPKRRPIRQKTAMVAQRSDHGPVGFGGSREYCIDARGDCQLTEQFVLYILVAQFCGAGLHCSRKK